MEKENKVENEKPTLRCPIAYAAALGNFEQLSNAVYEEVSFYDLCKCSESCAWYDKEEGRCGCLWS